MHFSLFHLPFALELVLDQSRYQSKLDLVPGTSVPGTSAFNFNTMIA